MIVSSTMIVSVEETTESIVAFADFFGPSLDNKTTITADHHDDHGKDQSFRNA